MSRALVNAVLDLEPDPLFLVDGEGRIAHKNRAAEGLCGDSGPFLRDAAHLRAVSPADTADLLERLRALARLHNLALADPAPLRLKTKPPLVLTFNRLGTEPPAMILVRAQDASTAVDDLCAAFSRSHGLGLGEARLLRALVNDLTLVEYCERDGLNLWTERSRLQALHRRCGVRRQTSLIVAVLTGVKGAAAPETASEGRRRRASGGAGARKTPSASAEPPRGDDGRVSLHPAGTARTPLPSLTGLKALEAFVRLGSMTSAALELRTFPSNISRHIHKLQTSTGITLTQGATTSVRPTQEALTLAAAAAAFDLVHRAAPDVTPPPRQLSTFMKAKRRGANDHRDPEILEATERSAKS